MRDKKEFDENYQKFSYQSILTQEYILPHQWVAEVLIKRNADYNKTQLPDRFWQDKKSKWSKEFRKQVQQAAKLMKRFSEEALLNFLKNNQYKFSLFPKANIALIESEQKIIDNRKIESKPIETVDANVFIKSKGRKKNNLLNKLKDNK